MRAITLLPFLGMDPGLWGSEAYKIGGPSLKKLNCNYIVINTKLGPEPWQMKGRKASLALQMQKLNLQEAICPRSHSL